MTVRNPRIYTTEGIILKRKAYGEADRIVTLISRNYGKMKVLAKGIRKVSSRRAPHLEVFTRVTCVIRSGSTMDTVTEVATLESYGDIRHDLERVSVGYYLCELVDSLLAERQEQPDVYALLSEALDRLGKRDTDMYALARELTLALLWALGFLPVGKTLPGRELQAFVESVTEKRLKSTAFARLLLDRRRA